MVGIDGKVSLYLFAEKSYEESSRKSSKEYETDNEEKKLWHMCHVLSFLGHLKCPLFLQSFITLCYGI